MAGVVHREWHIEAGYLGEFFQVAVYVVACVAIAVSFVYFGFVDYYYCPLNFFSSG